MMFPCLKKGLSKIDLCAIFEHFFAYGFYESLGGLGWNSLSKNNFSIDTTIPGVNVFINGVFQRDIDGELIEVWHLGAD